MADKAEAVQNKDADSTPPARPVNWQRLIAGAVAEVDPNQITVLRRLTPAQRFRQAVSMIELAEQVASYRLRLRRPELSGAEVLRYVRRQVNDLK